MLEFLKIWGKLLLIPASFFLLLMLSNNENVISSNERNSDMMISNIQPVINSPRYRTNVLDTIFTSKNAFVEVILENQTAYLHKKNGGTDTFLCSTGTEFLEKGQKTKAGIFIVRSKMPELISKQFNDTKCLNWVGFSFGVGFHALESKKYYWNLGKRPSSHGCIRLSQEDAKKLYQFVEVGTPVYIHGRSYARILKFIDNDDPSDTMYSKRIMAYYLKERIKNLYNGKYFFYKYPRLVTSMKYIGHEGIEMGDSALVAAEQKIPITMNFQKINIIISDQTDYFRNLEVFDAIINDTNKTN